MAHPDGLLPSLVAFVGGYLPWSIPLIDYSRHFELLNTSSAVRVLVGGILMIVTLASSRTFVQRRPQARCEVSAGPYRWIAHLLCLWKEIAVEGIVLQYISLVAMLVLVAHIAIQI